MNRQQTKHILGLMAGILVLGTFWSNAAATDHQWLNYYISSDIEYGLELHYDSPSFNSMARINYSLTDDVLVRGARFTYRTYTGLGPHDVKVKIESDDGAVQVSSSLGYAATYMDSTYYLNGPIYPVDDDPEVYINCTELASNEILLAIDGDVTTVEHSANSVDGSGWITGTYGEYFVDLLYEEIPEISVGTAETGTFNDTDNVDAFAIYLSSGFTYEFELTRTSGTGDFDMRLCSYDGLTDTSLRSTSGSSFPKIFQYTPSSPAGRLLLIDADSFSDTGSYQVNVTNLGTSNSPPDVPIVNGPLDEATIYTDHVLLNVTVTDPDDDDLTVWFREEDGSPSTLDIQLNVPSGSTVTYNYSGLSYGFYDWSVTAYDDMNGTSSGEMEFHVNDEENNTPPTVDTPTPANESTPMGPNVTLEVYVYDLNHDALTIEFFNASDDMLIGTASKPQGSGSFVQASWDGIGIGQECSWYVNVSDPFNTTTSPLWSFTTESGMGNQPPDAPLISYPLNGSTVAPPNVTLEVYVEDSESDPLLIEFFNASDGSLIGTHTNPSGWGFTATSWDGIGIGQECSWYVNVSDPFNTTTSPVWSFTTESGGDNTPPSEPLLNDPLDGFQTQGPDVLLNVWVNDADGDALSVHFYNASDNTLIGTANEPDGTGNVNITWSGLPLGDMQSWYVTVSDPFASTNSTTWSFTPVSGSGNSPPISPLLWDPNDGSIIAGPDVLLDIWIYDLDGDTLLVEFYDASDDTLIGTAFDEDNDEYVNFTWSELEGGITYSWYAIVRDGIDSTVSDTWSFTLEGGGGNGPGVGNLMVYIIIGAVGGGVALAGTVIVKKKNASAGPSRKKSTTKVKKGPSRHKTLGRPEKESGESVVDLQAPPGTGSIIMICTSCGKQVRTASPGEPGVATCDTCNVPFARIIECPGCSKQLYISKEFLQQHGGSTIACSKCKSSFLLKNG
ncbi:hypothetical protein GF325_01545 [Candidatus Bathyarchaeota archaeon]|nr:hypothetical protein [Candidatus Bathyarchaeota archaeon]